MRMAVWVALDGQQPYYIVAEMENIKPGTYGGTITHDGKRFDTHIVIEDGDGGGLPAKVAPVVPVLVGAR